MNKKVSGVFFSYLLIVVDILVTLLLLPYLWDNLGPDEYGLYKMLQSTAAFMSVMDFGLGGTITRYIVKFKTEGDLRKQENFMAMGLMIYGLLATVTLVISVGIAAVELSKRQTSNSYVKRRFAQRFLTRSTLSNL